MLRPFNFDTLATSVYQYASDELIADASLGALLIVLVGLAPVILMSVTIDRSRELKAAGIATLDPPATPPVTPARRLVGDTATRLAPRAGRLFGDERERDGGNREEDERVRLRLCASSACAVRERVSRPADLRFR